MKGRISGYSSDSEQPKQDLSIMRKPIHTALSGFLEAKKAYDNGTEEMKRLVAHECDIIYECKICRNIFRSLTNFLSHKRVYCCTAFDKLRQGSNNDGFIDHDISTIIQAEQEFINKSTTKENKNIEGSSKDLSSVIERLSKRQQTNMIMKLTDFYEQVSNKLTQDEVLRKQHVIQLDRVPNSDIAVYQTVKKEDCDNIKKEVAEIHDMLQKQNDSILDSTGKVMSMNKMQSTDMKLFECSNNNIETLRCNICKEMFLTQKTLKFHIQSKHITSTLVHQCPSCSQTFSQPGAVIRHLNSDHKKSMRRIRLMRESILKKKRRADEIHVKGPSRELARLQTDIKTEKERNDADNASWTDCLDRDSNLPKCMYCGKKFERKAVLTTHLNNCLAKNKTVTTRKNAETSNSVKGDDKKGLKGKDNDCEIINEQIKSINLVDKYEKIDLTVDELPKKRKRKTSPKVLLKNDETNSESFNELFWNFKSTQDLSLKTVSLDNLNKKQISEKNEDKSDNSSEKSLKEMSFFCKICEKKFDALSNLRRHISMFHYRQRKFGCKLCEYRAFRRYDVINHLNSAHSINGDREVVLEFIVVHKESEKLEDVDEDVIISQSGLLREEKEQLPVVTETKRGRKPKVPKIDKPLLDIDPNTTKAFTKLTRSSSSLSLCSNDDSTIATTSRRPIRNRVKPVKKDFVYDLSNLLKKDMIFCDRDPPAPVVPTRTHKRRNTIISNGDTKDDSNSVNNKSDIPAITTSDSSTSNTDKPIIQGSALKMAKLAVISFSACFCKTELPASRKTDSQHGFLKQSKVETSSKLQPNRTNCRRISDDSFIRTLTKKRKMEIESIFSDSETLKTDKKTKGKIPKATDGKESEQENKTIKNPSKKEFQEYMKSNKLTDPVKKINLSPFIEPSSQETSVSNSNRITLMQRLAENKHRKLTESLLRSALEN